MEELKILIDMVAHLPQMALWVLIGFLGYKLAVLGSIYGTLRLLIVKLHDWLTGPKRVEMTLGDLPINPDVHAALMTEIRRLRHATCYIHMSGVQRLRKALDEAGV